jgi:hypothetical protein
MHSTPQPTSAAGEHFADAERLLAALPLVKRGADRDRDVQVALVHATLAIAAILADEDDHGRPSVRIHSRRLSGSTRPRALVPVAIRCANE